MPGLWRFPQGSHHFITCHSFSPSTCSPEQLLFPPQAPPCRGKSSLVKSTGDRAGLTWGTMVTAHWEDRETQRVSRVSTGAWTHRHLDHWLVIHGDYLPWELKQNNTGCYNPPAIAPHTAACLLYPSVCLALTGFGSMNVLLCTCAYTYVCVQTHTDTNT